ncbi:MAG TPA: right-handed parallel beta-helix repeat-containing protein [Actinomycetota bacterium]|nr:right-handed parallel beta-helix repeat-containing protein [Actinomycetota bacterium]
MGTRTSWLLVLVLAGSLFGAAPASAGTVDVPPSACSATSDSAPALESFLATVPNGSTVVFPSGASCLMALSVNLGVPPSGSSQRADTVYDLNGATIFRTVEPSCSKPRFCNAPLIRLSKVKNVTLKGGTVHGGYDPGPTPMYDSTRAMDHGVAVKGSSGVTMSGLTIRDMGGDCVDVDRYSKLPSSSVSFTGTPAAPTTCRSVGRQGISANAIDGLTVSGVTFDFIGRSAVDIEPRLSWHARNVTVVGNSFGWAVNFAVAGVGSSAIWENVVVDGNVQTSASGVGFMWVGNKYQRGPITVTNNQVMDSLRISHTSGSATGNVMTSNPDGITCMFDIVEPADIVVSGNTPAPGVVERC